MVSTKVSSGSATPSARPATSKRNSTKGRPRQCTIRAASTPSVLRARLPVHSRSRTVTKKHSWNASDRYRRRARSQGFCEDWERSEGCRCTLGFSPLRIRLHQQLLGFSSASKMFVSGGESSFITSYKVGVFFPCELCAFMYRGHVSRV